MPRWIRPDATAEFLLLGYRFIGRACDRAGGDRADVVLLGRPTVVLRGREAARLIYNEHLFHRAGALPLRAQRTLTGVGGVQGLDGPTHRERKALFVDLLDEAAAQAIAALFVADWRERLESRPGRAVSVLDSSSLSLCAAVSAWCGMPVAGGGLVARNRDLRAMIESAARVGPGHWVGLAARERAERGLVRLVESLRDAPSLQPDSPLARIALGRDEHGWLLSPRVAAVEVLNVLRPTVAIARFVAFAAHAMAVHAQPDGWLASPQARLRFVHEVRRFYPFFPAVAAVASSPDVRSRRGPGCWSTCTALIGTRANALTLSPSTPAGSRPRRSPPGRFPLPQPRACSWSSRPESARPCSD